MPSDIIHATEIYRMWYNTPSGGDFSEVIADAVNAKHRAALAAETGRGEVVDFDAIADELAGNIHVAYSMMRPGSDFAVAARVVLAHGLRRLLGHVVQDVPDESEASRGE